MRFPQTKPEHVRMRPAAPAQGSACLPLAACCCTSCSLCSAVSCPLPTACHNEQISCCVPVSAQLALDTPQPRAAAAVMQPNMRNAATHWNQISGKSATKTHLEAVTAAFLHACGVLQIHLGAQEQHLHTRRVACLQRPAVGPHPVRAAGRRLDLLSGASAEHGQKLKQQHIAAS